MVSAVHHLFQRQVSCIWRRQEAAALYMTPLSVLLNGSLQYVGGLLHLVGVGAFQGHEICSAWIAQHKSCPSCLHPSHCPEQKMHCYLHQLNCILHKCPTERDDPVRNFSQRLSKYRFVFVQVTFSQYSPAFSSMAYPNVVMGAELCMNYIFNAR